MAEDTGNGVDNAGDNAAGGSEGSITLESVQAQLKEANDVISGFGATKDAMKGVKADMMKYKNEAKVLREAQEAQQKENADNTTDIDKLKTDYQGIFDGKDARINELTSTIRDLTVYGRVKSLASKAGAINPDEVVTLMRGDISFDDKGEPVIMGGKVNEKTGKPYSLDDFTTEFLGSRQHLVKSSGNSGAGSTSSGAGGGSGDAGAGGFKDLADLAKRGTPADYQKYRHHFMQGNEARAFGANNK
jgi:hypothetical protein